MRTSNPDDQAAAIVGSAPDLFSLEPNSAAHIQTNHVNTNGDVATLGRDLQRAYGPAVPPGVPPRRSAPRTTVAAPTAPRMKPYFAARARAT